MMLAHVKKGNVIKRLDQITDLFDEICLEHPIRIDVTKITKPIKLINLAWIIAICRKNYESFGNINFEDKGLNSMTETIRKKIIGAIELPIKVNLKPQYTPEVDLIYGVTVTDTLSYILPPELVIELITNNFSYWYCKRGRSC